MHVFKVSGVPDIRITVVTSLIFEGKATIDFNETPQLVRPAPTQFSDHEIEIIDRESHHTIKKYH